MNQNFLDSALKLFKYYESLGRRTMDQLADEELFFEPAADANSIAVIVKHMHGNMLSRWTDFLHADGEKEWRDRDGEFEDTLKNRADVYRLWEEGWRCLFDAIEPLQADDVERTVYIRNEGHSVMEAINRQQCHYAYHVGQVVYLGKIIRKEGWASLSIPKGGSGAFNKERFTKEKASRHFTDSLMDDDAKE